LAAFSAKAFFDQADSRYTVVALPGLDPGIDRAIQQTSAVGIGLPGQAGQ